MSFPELILIAVGLSMDAFAVAICKGMTITEQNLSKSLIIAVWFGGFQGLMPLLGYLLGMQFQTAITAIDHWVVFLLLSLIGANMIREGLHGDEADSSGADIRVKVMLPLALATAIDATAVGVTFAFLSVKIFFAALVIGIVTFGLTLAGVKVGAVFGKRYKAKAEFAGGAILILLGTKILAEHLGISIF